MAKNAKVYFVGALALLTLGGCATLDEGECLSGAWSEYGYRDGINGRSSERIADYAKSCSDYGVNPDEAAYLAGHRRGAIQYCTYQRGFERAERGDDYNQVCSGDLAADFAAGYDAGRAIYEVVQQHEALIDDYQETLDDLITVRDRLEHDEMSDKERRRLVKKELRLEDRRDSLRNEIRDFEYAHGLPRYRFG